MEEQVGAVWHRLVTRLADRRHPNARVYLADIYKTLSILFRALGGDGGLSIEPVDATDIRLRRHWLQRIAGSNKKIELAWRDDNALRLPKEVSWFVTRELNRDLYLWLAAMAASVEAGNLRDGDWIKQNQAITRKTLRRFPGLRRRYQRLVKAHLETRPLPEGLSGRDRIAEQSIRLALLDSLTGTETPVGLASLPILKYDPYPVPLWMHPDPPRQSPADSPSDDDDNNNERKKVAREVNDLGRRQAERVESPEGDRGLVTVRMENIFTWGEFVNVDRGTEDEEDPGQAESIARDLDKLSVARNDKAAASILKFDLDLPSDAQDDTILTDGILLPEWDWKQAKLLPDRCHILELMSTDAEPMALPGHLARTAKRLRHQFQALAPARTWHQAQQDGQEIDLDAYLNYAADLAAGHGVGGDSLYKSMHSGERDLACLLLADLSLSTDSWIDDHHRVIDVIRDALFLFAESLHATGDRFSMYGFSSRRRDPIRVHRLKAFNERYNASIRGRINVIKPGYYTRMGAGIRHATEILSGQPATRRLLLVLTDGKPNDLDQYEGRFGIEDTRQAVLACRKAGLQPFCVTIDDKGNDYLPHLFGKKGYVIIRNPAELPKKLPLLYAQLTG